LQQAFSDDATWAEATAAVGREGTSAQSENALAVLRNHRGKHLLANESTLAKQVAQLHNGSSDAGRRSAPPSRTSASRRHR
jgi:hypothetical protein